MRHITLSHGDNWIDLRRLNGSGSQAPENKCDSDGESCDNDIHDGFHK